MPIKCAKTPLVCVIIIACIGIIFGKYLSGFISCLLLSVLTISLYIVFIRRNNSYFLLFLALLFAFATRYNLKSRILPQDHLIRFSADSVKTVSGVIKSARISVNGNHQYILDCDTIYTAHQKIPVTGKVLLRSFRIRQKFAYGMRIIIRGKLYRPPVKRNPGQFDYRRYLAGDHIHHMIDVTKADSVTIKSVNAGSVIYESLILAAGDYCQKTFRYHLDPSSGALLQALLLGEKQDIERDIKERFQEVGVVHVLAISGLHVGYVVLFVFTALSLVHLPLKTRILVLGFVLLFYIILIDFKPPVMRASLMVMFYYWGKTLQRKISSANLLAGAALIILIFNPRELFNPGFQFSFIAVISIIYGYRRLDEYLPLRKIIKRWKPFEKMIWDPLLVSLAAVVGTLPLTLYYYGTIPLIAIIANVIVIPLIGCIVLLGFFLLIMNSVSAIIAGGIGILIRLIYDLLKWVTQLFSGLSFASVHVSRPGLLCTFLLGTGIALLWFLNKKQMIKILPYYAGIIILYSMIKSIPGPPELQATFIDVGQGDAALLRFPNQKTMLIDAGDCTSSWDHGKKTIMPFLKYIQTMRLNYLVGSHPHDDHIGGFSAILDYAQVDTLVVSRYSFNSKIYKDLLMKCLSRNIPIKYVRRGDQLYPDSTCRVYILHPDSTHAQFVQGNGAECNNSSLVMKVQYGRNSILFTGDLEIEAEPALFAYQDFLESEIIKIGHHGSKTSTSDELIKFVQPLVGIISVARKNTFKHPSPGTLRRLHDNHVHTYLTSNTGAQVFYIGPDRIRKYRWKD